MKSCPDCGREFEDNITFCPNCGTILNVEDKSKKKKRQTILQEDIFYYLNKNFEEVYALGYKNVHNIELFQGDPSDRKANWIKQSSALILKDDRAYLSVEMTPSDLTTPKDLAGNILVHTIAESVVVRIKGGIDEETEYILDNEKFPRYLLIVLPDPSELKESRKDEQIQELEKRIKNLGFLEKTALKNFNICYVNNFENSIQELLKD